MKFILIFICTILIAAKVSSQNQDSLKLLAQAAEKAFTWDIQKADKGNLMFLDVPYIREGKDSTEYLTLTVAKYTAEKRPAFISVIVPNNILQSGGIFITFANSVNLPNGERKMQLAQENPNRILFEKCEGETCTARIISGYVVNEKTKQQVDIFQKFFEFDHVLFLFVYADGSHKSVAIPLFSFKRQYKELQ